MGIEPMQAEPNRLAVHRLKLSATWTGNKGKLQIFEPSRWVFLNPPTPDPLTTNQLTADHLHIDRILF